MADSKCCCCTQVIKQRDKSVITCIICEGKYHNKCINLKEVEIKCIQESNNLRFSCNNCSNNSLMSELRDLKKILLSSLETLQEYNEILEKHTSQINVALKMANQEAKNTRVEARNSYADVVQKTSREIIVVKPINEEQNSNTTQEEIREKIDPSKLGVRVENIRNIKNGGIIINCSNADSKNKLKNKVKEELGNKYKIEDPKLKNPKIKIKNTELKFISKENGNIINDIIEQNELNEEMKTKLTIIKKYENKRSRNSGNIIMEVKSDVFKDIINRQKLNVGWRVCEIEEYHNIVQCYKCAGFNHFAKDCENSVTCFKCSGDHKTDACMNDHLKCINCVKVIEKLKINLDYNHAAFDKACACLTRNIEHSINRTNYGI